MRTAARIAGAILVIAGLTVWVAGTGYLVMAGGPASHCGVPAHRASAGILACGVGGPLIVAAGHALLRRPRGTLVFAALAALMLVGLAGSGALSTGTVDPTSGVSQSSIRCDG